MYVLGVVLSGRVPRPIAHRAGPQAVIPNDIPIHGPPDLQGIKTRGWHSDKIGLRQEAPGQEGGSDAGDGDLSFLS